MVCGGQVLWNLLDTVVVANSLGQLFLEGAFADLAADSPHSLQNIRILRILRITRLMRLTKLTRLVRFLKGLRSLIHSILYTVQSLVWAVVLLALMVYFFALVFT